MEKKKTSEEKILFIINFKAGTGIELDLEAEIKKLSAEHLFQYKILNMTEDHDATRIEEEMNKFNPSIAVAGGGDGTVNLIARQVLDRDIRMGIIPLGSSNGMAYQLNIPGQPMDALNNIFSGKSQSIDVLMINEKYICLHLSDLGMNARVIKRYEKEGIRGLYGYARQYFKELGNIRKFRCHVHADHEQLTAKVVMIILANASYYGTGANINPGGRPDDGKFEILLIRSITLRFLFYLLLSLIIKDHGKQKRFIRTLSCSSVRISIHPAQEMQVDGEPFGVCENLEAKILPGKIRMIPG